MPSYVYVQDDVPLADEILVSKPPRKPWYRWPLVAFMAALLGAGLWYYASTVFGPQPLVLRDVLLWVGLGMLVGLAVLIRDDTSVVALGLLLLTLTLVGAFVSVPYLSDLARFEGTWVALGVLTVLSVRGAFPGRNVAVQI